MKIRFIESPTGQPFYLAYSAGQFADLPDDLAAKLIDEKIAIAAKSEDQSTKEEIDKQGATVSSNNPTVKRTLKSRGGKKSSKS